MDNSDSKEFREIVAAHFEVIGKDAPSLAAMRLWWSALCKFPLARVIQAFADNLAHNKYPPKPADIISLLEIMDGRPTAEEAWATALRSSDEAETIVWTDEISQAMACGAGDLLADGDKTAARMAFRDSYNRLLTDARANGRPVHFWVSLGHSKERRNDAINQAIAKGLLTHEQGAVHLLEGPVSTKITKLITGAIAEPDTEKRQEHLAGLKKHCAES